LEWGILQSGIAYLFGYWVILVLFIMQLPGLLSKIGLCLLIFCTGVIHAQWRSPRLTHLGPLQGMTSWTFEVTQDSTGYMYFGTDQGLVRYDGSRFELFAHNPNDTHSIGPGDVQSVMASSGGLIWLGTRLSGLHSFDPLHRRFRHYPYPGIISSGYATVHCILEDGSFLWLGGDNYLLHRFDKTTGQFESFRPAWISPEIENDRFSLTEIFQDRLDPDRLWMALINHNPKYAGKKATWLISFHKGNKTFQRHECWGSPRHQDPDGRIWLTSEGINRYDPASGTCEHFPVFLNGEKQGPEVWIRDLVRHQGSFLLSAPQALLRFQDHGEVREVAYGKELGNMGDLFVDGQKNTWIGRTNGISVLRAQEESIRYFSFSHFGFSGRIYPGRMAYQPDSNKIFVVDHSVDGTGRKIMVLDLDTGISSLFYESPHPIHGIVVDTSGQLWMSSNGAFYTLAVRGNPSPKPKRENSHASPVPWLWNLSLSPGGWIAGTGIHQFWWFKPGEPARVLNLDQLDSAGQGKSVSRLQGLSFTRQDEALLFSNRIFSVDLQSGKITPLLMEDHVNPFPYTDIHSVMQDHRGHIWVSNLAMTAEFKRSGDRLDLVKKYSAGDGLGAAWVHEITVDERGRIWAFAQNGLQVIDPVLKEARSFGVREGLENPYIDPRQVLHLKDGRIVSVNGPGIILFHPDTLWNLYTPRAVPLVIREIRIAGQTLPPDTDLNGIKSLRLKPDQNFLDVQFQALAYPTDFKMTYSYTVDGLHPGWISIGENKIITLPTLSPGDYVLKIKAGEPSSPAPEKELSIHVAAPLIGQAWFRVLSVLCVAGLLAGLFFWRTRRIRLEEAGKALVSRQMAELEMKALRAQMNPHFMFNSLNSIKNYIFRAEPKTAAQYLSNFAHLIRLTLDHSREKRITLKQELDALLLYIELEQMRFENRFELVFDVPETLDLHRLYIPPLLLQPFVENAIWHGIMHKQGKGHLRVGLSKCNGVITCVIEDDGVGRTRAGEIKKLNHSKYQSMGISIMEDRIEIINKLEMLQIRIEILDKLDDLGNPAGTRVNIRIPELSED